MPQTTPSTPPRSARLAIWSPGTFPALSGEQFTFTEDDCKAIAGGYSSSLFAAPLVKGHPKTDDPAQGWTDGLEWDGEYVWADLDKLDPVFAEEWRAGRWGKISPRFFRPNDPGNPTPGQYYLRHIGMLGAAAPANKGLPRAEFSEDDGTVTFADDLPELPAAEFGERQRWAFAALSEYGRRIREWLLLNTNKETADELAPEYLLDTLRNAGDESDVVEAVAGFCATPTQEPAMTDTTTSSADTAFAEREAAIAEREAAAEKREQEISQRLDATRRDDCTAFAEGLADAGRIVPADLPFVTELLFSIGEDEQVSFAEGDGEVTVATGERLRDFFNRLPVQIDYTERSAPEDDAETTAFAAPHGQHVDQGRAELHGKALAYQKKHGCDYATAASAVGA